MEAALICATVADPAREARVAVTGLRRLLEGLRRDQA
jgi:hypothetical protein